MPNWCSNNLVFYSEKQDLIGDLYMKFCHFWNLNDSRYVMDFFYEAGYAYEDQINTDRRDYISWLSDSIAEGDGKFYFELSVESAWSPHLDIFFKYMKDKYNCQVKIKYFSEECGCEIFESNDFEGKFFTTRYKVNYAHNNNSDTEYFDTREELAEFIEQEIGVKIAPHLLINNLKVMEKGLDIGLKKNNPNDYIIMMEVEMTNHYEEIYSTEVPF